MKERATITDKYVARRVEHALKKAGGDVAVAQRLLTRLCDYDSKLMQRLTAPYLPGIIARTLTPKPPAKSRRRAKPARGAKKPPDIPAVALDAMVGQLAEHIGESKSPQGMTALVQPTVKTTCSPRHLEAVQTLIGAFGDR